MAERLGFEPRLEFPLNTLSKRAPSATQAGTSTRRRARIRVCATVARLICKLVGELEDADLHADLC